MSSWLKGYRKRYERVIGKRTEQKTCQILPFGQTPRQVSASKQTAFPN